MSAELPRRSLAAQQVATELCTLSSYNKHSSVDVASTLDVNHVKPTCYVIISCDYDSFSQYLLSVT